jgi:hypothetical protein
VDLDPVDLDRVDRLEAVDLDPADRLEATGRADLDRVDRAGPDRAVLERADLERAGLDRADLDRADLERADLERADLDRADPDRAVMMAVMVLTGPVDQAATTMMTMTAAWEEMGQVGLTRVLVRVRAVTTPPTAPTVVVSMAAQEGLPMVVPEVVRAEEQ